MLLSTKNIHVVFKIFHFNNVFYFLYEKVAEWSKAVDCKSIRILILTKVQTLLFSIKKEGKKASFFLNCSQKG